MSYAMIMFFYCLGLTGLAAFGLLPVRLWKMFELVSKIKMKNKIKIFVVFFIILFISVYIEINTLKSISKCIMYFECTPNRANKLIHLAILGVTYIAVEILFLVIKTTYRGHLKKSGDV